MYRKHAFVFTNVEKGIICADSVPHSLPLVNCSKPSVYAVCPTPCLWLTAVNFTSPPPSPHTHTHIYFNNGGWFSSLLPLRQCSRQQMCTIIRSSFCFISFYSFLHISHVWPLWFLTDWQIRDSAKVPTHLPLYLFVQEFCIFPLVVHLCLGIVHTSPLLSYFCLGILGTFLFLLMCVFVYVYIYIYTQSRHSTCLPSFRSFQSVRVLHAHRLLFVHTEWLKTVRLVQSLQRGRHVVSSKMSSVPACWDRRKAMPRPTQGGIPMRGKCKMFCLNILDFPGQNFVWELILHL